MKHGMLIVGMGKGLGPRPPKGPAGMPKESSVMPKPPSEEGGELGGEEECPECGAEMDESGECAECGYTDPKQKKSAHKPGLGVTIVLGGSPKTSGMMRKPRE